MPRWSGNRMALTMNDHCWQYDPQFGAPVAGSEDCLYLNLFKPLKPKTSEPLPVLVFIHGGGFYSGTNNPMLYGPDFFMETGEVILVVPTYRVNVFGFISTGDEAATGNYGLKDQTMALRWVKDNVKAFGGDAKRVTLMGQSAGSVSVSYHMISPLSEGLFHNAILLSGFINTAWGMPRKDPREFTNKHARLAGIEAPEQLSTAQLVEKMRQLPAQVVAEAIPKLYVWESLPVTNYLPAVEPIGTPGAFLTAHPMDVLQQGAFKQVPLLINTVLPNDGINFVQPLLLPGEKWREFNNRIYQLLPLVLYMDPANANIRPIVDRVRFKYFGPNGLIEGEQSMEGVQKLATDYLYYSRYHWLADCLLQKGAAPTYLTQFTYCGQNSLAHAFVRGASRKYKASHADDLIYLFRMRFLYPQRTDQLSEGDEKMRQMYMGRIINFVKSSRPGFEAATKDDRKIVVFRNDEEKAVAEDVMGVDRDAAEFEFWQEIDAMYTEGVKK